MESLEERRLLNPAFVGTLLMRAAFGHSKGSKRALPYVYSYLVPPLLLHRETRERLPSSVATTLISWAERNGDLLAPLPRRIAELAPSTREALLLMTSHGMANLAESSGVLPAVAEETIVDFEKKTSSTEVSDCLRRAYFVGRWLSVAGTIPTVLTALGVRL